MFRQGIISKLAKHSPQHRHTKNEAAQLSSVSIALQSQGVNIPEQFKSQLLVLVNDSEEEAHEDEDEVPDDFLYLAVLLLLSLVRSLSVSLLLLMFLFRYLLRWFSRTLFLLVCCAPELSRS